MELLHIIGLVTKPWSNVSKVKGGSTVITKMAKGQIFKKPALILLYNMIWDSSLV